MPSGTGPPRAATRLATPLAVPLAIAGAIAGAIALALSGCGDPAPDRGSAGAVQLSDSAGVSFVRDASPGIPLSLREVLRVGVIEGDPDHQFHRIQDLALEADGAFWVADSDPSLRRFDAGGRLTGRAGRAGEGPGEADRWLRLVAGDGWVLASGIPPRLHLFDTGGRLVAERSALLEGGGNLIPLGGYGDRVALWLFRIPDGIGGAAGGHGDPAGPRTPFRRMEVEIITGPSELEPLASVGVFPGMLFNAQGGSGPRILGEPAFAVDRRGWLHVSDSLAYRIESRDEMGSLRRVVERRLEPRSLPADFEDELSEGIAIAYREGIPGVLPQGMPEAAQREQVERNTAGAIPPRYPPHLPFIDRIFVAPGGELWVERADLHPAPAMRAAAQAIGLARWAWHPAWRAPQTFDLLDSRGHYRGTVELPFEFEPMAVTGERVYGVETDGFGVERIVAFEIEG